MAKVSIEVVQKSRGNPEKLLKALVGKIRS